MQHALVALHAFALDFEEELAYPVGLGERKVVEICVLNVCFAIYAYAIFEAWVG